MAKKIQKDSKVLKEFTSDAQSDSPTVGSAVLPALPLEDWRLRNRHVEVKRFNHIEKIQVSDK